MNLGTARILIIVALVAVGAVVLANGFDDETATSASSPTPSVTPSASVASPTGSATASPTDEPSETPAPNTSDVIIAVLNGTGVPGLAAAAQDMLVSEGYETAGDPGNAPQPGVEVTTVYYRTGDDVAQNRADATYISETFFPDSKVAKLDPAIEDEGLIEDSVTVTIVVGQDYAESVAA